MNAESLIFLAAFAAGFIDSVVGGGGLIQLPALLIAYPAERPTVLLGTNRTSSIFGTTLAAWRYARETAIPWAVMLPTGAVAALASQLGAQAAMAFDPAAFKPLILFVLIAVAIYTWINNDFGKLHRPTRSLRAQRLIGAASGAVIGFYDGFLGPGTGSFLIFAFVGLLGFSFLAASASAKVINVATNAASWITFLVAGQVLLPLGLVMAACNMIGSVLGTRMALRYGSGFVRNIFLVVVPLIIARFAYDLWLAA